MQDWKKATAYKQVNIHNKRLPKFQNKLRLNMIYTSRTSRVIRVASYITWNITVILISYCEPNYSIYILPLSHFFKIYLHMIFLLCQFLVQYSSSSLYQHCLLRLAVNSKAKLVYSNNCKEFRTNIYNRIANFLQVSAFFPPSSGRYSQKEKK